MDNTRELFALANLVLCFTAVGMCLCRLNSMTRTVLYTVRSKYAVIVAAALCSALQPWWGEWPGWASLAMSGSLVFALTVGKRPWRNDPPLTTRDLSKEG